MCRERILIATGGDNIRDIQEITNFTESEVMSIFMETDVLRILILSLSGSRKQPKGTEKVNFAKPQKEIRIDTSK